LQGGVAQLATTCHRVGLRLRVKTTELLAPLTSPFTAAVSTSKHRRCHLVADRSSSHRRSLPPRPPSHSPFSLSTGHSAKHSHRAPPSPPLLNRAGRSPSVPHPVPSGIDPSCSPPLLLRAPGVAVGAPSCNHVHHQTKLSKPPHAPVRTSPLSLVPSPATFLLADIRCMRHRAAGAVPHRAAT
jgi:hypothetical protein